MQEIWQTGDVGDVSVRVSVSQSGCVAEGLGNIVAVLACMVQLYLGSPDRGRGGCSRLMP